MSDIYPQQIKKSIYIAIPLNKVCKHNLSHNCFRILFYAVFSIYHVKLNLHISGAFSPPVSDSPLRQCPPAPPPPHPSCVRNTFQPATSFPHFILHMFSNLFLSISLSPGQPTSLPPSRLSLRRSPCSVTVSSHSINQACEARAQCSTASHSPSLVPSVPVSLPHSLSHFKKV